MERFLETHPLAIVVVALFLLYARLSYARMGREARREAAATAKRSLPVKER